MIKLTEEVKTSMAPTWKEVMSDEDELIVQNQIQTKRLEMDKETRKVFALEKIADLLEIFVKIKLKEFDPEYELLFETPVMNEEYEENGNVYPETIEEEDLPPVPKPENFEDEITTEIYVKDIIRPSLTDAVLEKVEVSVGENGVMLKLPWLDNEKSYREDMEWRDMASDLRTNGFEWVSDGKNSHWLADA